MPYKSTYRHVPVPTEEVTEARVDAENFALVKGREKARRPVAQRSGPTFHHGANPDQDQRLSGELRCTLTALSPLLVANQQVKVGKLSNGMKRQLEDFCERERTRLLNFVDTFSKRNNEDLPQLQRRKQKTKDDINSQCDKFPQNKMVLFPLQLGGAATAQVVIPGEGIKGMLRHLIGSLTGAPLDRVGEATHSSRPNAKLPPPNQPLRTIPIAGRVIKNMTKECLDLQIEPIVDIGKIEWVHGSRLQVTGTATPCAVGDWIDAKTTFGQKVRVQQGYAASARFRWKDRGQGQNRTGARGRLLAVRYGLDIGQELHQAHKGPPLGAHEKHEQALVPESLFVRGTLNVEHAVVKNFKTSREHAVSKDEETGHLTKDNPISGKVRRPLREHPLPHENDLMFFELLLPQSLSYSDACNRLRDIDPKRRINLHDCKIISCGQNYYYRWRHVDSVTKIAWGWDGKDWRAEPRPEFVDPQGPAKDGLYALQNMLSGRTLSLAGRISVNSALERVKPGAELTERFIDGSGGTGFDVWLQPLASPKGPSWARGYVPGNEGNGTGKPLRTLGDGIVADPGKKFIEVQNLATTGFGPKHYLHHSATLGDPHKKTHYDLPAFIAAREKAGNPDPEGAVDRRKALLSDQAAVALRVSRPGTELGFTVRFRDLLPAELGALAVALNPDLIASVEDALPEQCRRLLADVPAIAVGGLERRFGLRLGHGKPLGMGSVAVTIDSAVSWQERAVDMTECIKAALRQKLILEQALAPTLEVLRLDSDAQSYLSQELVNGGQSELRVARSVREAHSDASRKNGFGT